MPDPSKASGLLSPGANAFALPSMAKPTGEAHSLNFRSLYGEGVNSIAPTAIPAQTRFAVEPLRTPTEGVAP